MKYRLVQCIEEGRLVATEFDNLEALLAECEVRGFELAGLHRSDWGREELQGQPKFTELCGPMWGGDAIRYEDVEAYRILST